MSNFKKVTLLLFVLKILTGVDTLYAQNSMVGDGFGGRGWYKPYNYTVGSYAGYTVCGKSGQLYSWGRNKNLELGNGTGINSPVPVKVPGMTHVVYYTTGYQMIVIQSDSAAWGWGTGISNFPIKIKDSIKFADAGDWCAIMIHYDGTVWSMGRNVHGMFGNGTASFSKSKSPVKMIGMTKAVRVASAGTATIILLSDGTLMSTGTNWHGILGNGDTSRTKRYTPVKVSGLKNIIDIKAIAGSALALDKFGDVYSWGDGFWGALGNGSKDSNSVPQKITALKNIVAISGCNDGDHFLALDSWHNCYAWGGNYLGQLGNGGRWDTSRPVLVATGVNDIMAGENFSYIIKTNNTLWGVGGNTDSGASIWLNLKDTLRSYFTQIDPVLLNICPPEMMDKRSEILLCEGEKYTVGKHTYTQTGFYQDTISGKSGDTIIFSNLLVRPRSTKDQQFTVCQGQKILVGKHSYDKPGIYFDTLKNTYGCDSLIKTEIIHLLPTDSSVVYTICQGQSVQIGIKTVNSPGIYKEYYKNKAGCDSVFEATVFVLLPTDSNRIFNICKGQEIQIDNKKYSKPGKFYDTLVNSDGCDSIITTEIIYMPLTADFNIDSSAFPVYSFVNVSSPNALQFKWNFNHKDSFSYSKNGVHDFGRDLGEYTICLIATDSNSCKDTVCKKLHLWRKEFFLANVFTPGNDGFNDLFRIGHVGHFLYDLRIHNRWGEKMYEVKNADVTNENLFWNGSVGNTGAQCPSGTYFYRVEIFLNGTKNKPKIVTGSITLIREQ